jgi:hypothetical protein
VIDDGWQTNRDISVRVSTWSWIDLRVLVEHHGPAKRLARASMRLRFTPAGLATIALVYGALVAAIASELSISATWMVLIAAAGLSFGFRWLWRAAETLVAAERTIHEAAHACQLRTLHAPPPKPGRGGHSTVNATARF